MRAREIRERLKGRIDPELMRVLESIAEEQGVLRETIRTLAEHNGQVIRILEQVVTVTDKTKGIVDKIKKKDPGDEFQEID